MAFQVMTVSLGGDMAKCKLIVFMALIDNSDQLDSPACLQLKVLREAACAIWCEARLKHKLKSCTACGASRG